MLCAVFTMLIQMNQALMTFNTEICVLYTYEVCFHFIRVNVIFASMKKLGVHICKNRFCFLFTIFIEGYYF